MCRGRVWGKINGHSRGTRGLTWALGSCASALISFGLNDCWCSLLSSPCSAPCFAVTGVFIVRVALKVSDAGMYAGVIKTKLPHAYFEGETIVVQSPLGADASLGQHVSWFSGIVMYERPILRRAIANGAKVVVEASVSPGPIRISPHDVLMLHLLNADLILNVS